MDNIHFRIADVIQDSIVDGPGLRYVIFFQGCPHNCLNCHNPKTHELEGGHIVSSREIVEGIKKNPLLDGVTFSGGEPFLQSEGLGQLAKILKKEGLSVYCYTGYTYEYLKDKGSTHQKALLKSIDCLIDGPYIESEKTLDCPFVGSKNQRVIMLKEGEAVDGLTHR